MAQPDQCSAGKAGGLLSVDAARLRTIAAVAPMRQAEDLPLDQALGRVLVDPSPAQVDLPPFDNSAMDGYAVSTRDLAGDGPWRLPVSDRIAAGDTRAVTLQPGTAARIFTGAPRSPLSGGCVSACSLQGMNCASRDRRCSAARSTTPTV
ncbi:MAG: hypothetical protein ACP5DX_09485 [Paracoccaceae bacterium]